MPVRPISTHEQREAIRMLAMAVGIREAARQSGLNESRVQQWSKRYNWLAKRPDKSLKPTKNDMSPTVTIAADRLAETLANDKSRTIFALSQASRKHAEHLAKQKPSIDVKRSVVARNWTAVADTVHGINPRSSENDQRSLDVRVLAGRGRTFIAIENELAQETNEKLIKDVSSDNESDVSPS